MVQTVWTKEGLKCLDTLEEGLEGPGLPTATGVTSFTINTNHDSTNSLLEGVGVVMISGVCYAISSSAQFLLFQMSSYYPSNGFSALPISYRTQPWLSTSAFGSQSQSSAAILGNTSSNTAAQGFGYPIVFQMFIYAKGTSGSSSSWPNQRYGYGVCNYNYISTSSGSEAVKSGRMSFQLPYTAALRQIRFNYNTGNIRGKIKCWSFTNMPV